MLVYKFNVLEALKDHGYNTGVISRNKILGAADVQKLRENVVLGVTGIEKLCLYLKIQPGSLIRVIPDEQYDELKAADKLKDYEIVDDKFRKDPVVKIKNLK